MDECPGDHAKFSDEGNVDADVIIEQHAPYAGREQTGDLLELDEEPEEETFWNFWMWKVPWSEDEDTGDVRGSGTRTAMYFPPLEKDETDMEEPDRDLMGVPCTLTNAAILISSFIKDEPGPIRADQETSLKGDVSLASIREHDGFITDTLAQIYVKQGLYAKAIYAYEKLSLKYPEKSAYFAAQIEKIRNINHS